MAQLIIEYLLLCQDQITNQLVDYEQIKGKSVQDHEESRREMEKLRNDLNTTKKESKKRKKMIDTLQKMLMTQQPAHHTCPICAHSFLSVDYLQAHIHRRHPEYGSGGRREHDVDIEKEIQRVKDELRSKETELQLIKVQKAVDEQRIREREENIRQLKEDMQALTNKMSQLEEKYLTLISSTKTQPTSPSRQRETGVKELLKENKSLRAENEQLKQLLQQAENNFKKEEKQKRRLQREIENLQKEINHLNENIRTLENASGDTNRLSEELIRFRNSYNEEKNRRKKLQDELDEANKQLSRLRNQPPPITDRKSPVPTPRSSISPPPIPSPVRPTPRPVKTTEIYLPQYCPSLVRKINQNPRYLNEFRNNTKKQFNDELQQHEDLNINEKDTRLSDNDYQTKIKIVEQTRRNMQDDLPNFERIRNELSRTLDKLAMERINNPYSSVTSIRSSTGKFVKFEEDSQRQQPTSSIKRPSTIPTTVQPKPKYDNNYKSTKFASDDDEKTNTYDSDDDYDQPTKSGFTNDIQPSPRKNIPSTGVSALVSGNIKPVTTNNTKTISALVRPKSTINENETESDEESQPIPNVATKTQVLDKKLNEISSKGQKPTINAIAQGFQPSHKTLSTKNNKADDDDDSSDSSITSIHDTNPYRKPSVGTLPQNSGRQSLTHNQNLSSGDVSQFTYDSIWKSPAGKGPDLRRPPTADSAKTSNMDSDDDLEGEDSN
ncbi:unnamed protein product [Rotaria sp. Silwood2]|nr:unnamed protein product [Rotaria sp. Silwood2]